MFNDLDGLNGVGSAQSKITIKGNLDSLTINMLYRNYEHIARNLEVYPTVTIYPNGHKLNGGLGGFYYSNKNHIEMVGNDYLITVLAHEMRHAFQYIYFPDRFFATQYTSAREYLNCDIERDARGYSLDFCIAREYWEEANFISEEEEQIELVIQKKLSPKILGINERYFRSNPAVATSVPRDYHWEQRYTQEDIVHRNSKRDSLRDFYDTVNGLGLLIFIICILWYLFKNI